MLIMYQAFFRIHQIQCHYLKKTRRSNVKSVITKSQLLTWWPYVFTVFPNTLSVLNVSMILKLRKKLWSIWYHFTSSMFNNVNFAPTPVLIQHGLTIICQRNIHKLEGAHLNSKKSLCQSLNLPFFHNLFWTINQWKIFWEKRLHLQLRIFTENGAINPVKNQQKELINIRWNQKWYVLT